jgi:predicted DCC family thiol-disulfide oxidoreductase YuxK
MNVTGYTVVYDGHCNVCTRLANVLRAWDGELEVVASQSPGVMERFPWIPPAAYAEALQLVGPGGTTWQGAAAIEQLLNILPRGRLFSWAFHIPLLRGVADRFYRWFARNRYQFGCGDHCRLEP